MSLFPAVAKVARRFVHQQLQSDYLDSIDYLSQHLMALDGDAPLRWRCLRWLNQPSAGWKNKISSGVSSIGRSRRSSPLPVAYTPLPISDKSIVSHACPQTPLAGLPVTPPRSNIPGYATDFTFANSPRSEQGIWGCKPWEILVQPAKYGRQERMVWELPVYQKAGCQGWWGHFRSQVRELRRPQGVNPGTAAVHYLCEWHSRDYIQEHTSGTAVTGFSDNTQTANQCTKQRLAATVSNIAATRERFAELSMRMNTSKIQVMLWGTRQGLSRVHPVPEVHILTGKGWTIMLLLKTWVSSSTRKSLSPPMWTHSIVQQMCTVLLLYIYRIRHFLTREATKLPIQSLVLCKVS